MRITGLKKEEVLGKTALQLFPNLLNEPQDLIGKYGKVATTGEPERFYSLFELRNVWYSLYAFSPKKGYLVMLFEDITERKNTEENLRKSEERLNMAQEIGRMGSWEFHVREGKALWSSELFRIFNLQPMNYGPDIEEYRKFIHPEDLQRVIKLVEPFTFQGHLGEAVKFDYRIVLNNGKIRTLHTERVVKAVSQAGDPLIIMGIEQDITERKQVEIQLEEYSRNLEKIVDERTKQLKDTERLATIGQTAGMVGHDIRNPLQSMIGEVYLLKADLGAMPESKLKNEVTESFDSIERNILYISKIVADLQDYARPLNPEYKQVDFGQILVNVFDNLYTPDEIKISLDIKTCPKFTSDPEFIRRALTNLINNAIQAMPNGGQLDIRCFEKNDYVFISVSDTGCGIPKEVQPKLFTPMMTTKAKGQGMGLAVVKRLVEALNGSITFESSEGQGTTFTICLPKTLGKKLL